MNATTPALAALLFLPAGDLSIDYTAKRALEVTIETEMTSETTSMSMEIDGEPVGGGGRFGGGGPSEYRREVVYTETVLAHEDGKPTKVKRSFDTVSATRTSLRRDETVETDIESPMEDIVLIVELDDGDVVASLEDDEDPERSEMLEGHKLQNVLHGLLPADGEGEEWEPEAAGIGASLLLDVERALFPPPQFDESGGGGGRGGGRGRGGFGGGGGTSLAFLNGAEWDAKAKLSDRTEEVDGVECVVIEFELDADGEMPEAAGGRGGRDSLAGPTSAPVERIIAGTFEIELTGKLYFSVKEHRPVQLELEGDYTQDTLTERETQRGEMRMERTVEGSIEHTVTISAEDA